jgi:hypothetical protein
LCRLLLPNETCGQQASGASPDDPRTSKSVLQLLRDRGLLPQGSSLPGIKESLVEIYAL